MGPGPWLQRLGERGFSARGTGGSEEPLTFLRAAAAASLGQGNNPKFTLSCSFKTPAGQGRG